MKPFCCMALAFLLLIVSFIPGVCRGEGAEPVRTQWTLAELLADYDAAWALLRENDPFLPLLSAQGFDLDALQAEYRTAAAQIGGAEELAALLSNLFARLGNPGHLSVLTPAAYADYVGLLENGTISPDDPLAALVLDAQTAATYAAFAASAFGSATERGVGAFRRPEVWYDAGRDILYLYFYSFHYSLIDRDATVVADAIEAHPRVRDIVFILLGNGGGSDYYWIDNLVLPFGEGVSYAKTVFYSLTPMNLQYGLDTCARPISEYPGNFPSFVSELGFTHFAENVYERTAEDFSGKTVSCAARRWVLIDENVYSAADGFASFCKETGWATLVGFPTGGDGFGMSPFLARLPNTGLLLRFTTGAAANDDGSLNALSGTRPDFMPKPKETIQDACLRLILAR